MATNSTHGYNWPVSNLMKTIKIIISIISRTPTNSQVLILSKRYKLGFISPTLQSGKLSLKEMKWLLHAMQLKSHGRFQLHSPSPGLFLLCLLMPLEIKENYSQWPTPTLCSSSAYFLLLEESDEQLQHPPEEDQSAFHWKKSFPEKSAEGAM